MSPSDETVAYPQKISFLEVLRTFLKLGCSSFGGPVAHLGYFREEFVVRRRWLAETAYADLMALCQFLPGPMSSQVALGIGLLKAGVPGACAAWLGFTLPSAVLMLLFASGITSWQENTDFSHALHGLLVVAVAVVARAVWGMATTLCPDRARATLALLAAVGVLAWPCTAGQMAALSLGGIGGWLFVRTDDVDSQSVFTQIVSHRVSVSCLVLFFLLLVGLPVLGRLGANQTLIASEAFYRTGALVFGGGHVVLPLLQAEVVQPGWTTEELFLAGYGVAQAVPGPMFSFAAYLGAVIQTSPGSWLGGWLGGLVCLVTVFLPSFLLIIGILPFWQVVRQRSHLRSVVAGINAGVVGLLIAAFYDPVWTHGILSSHDVILGLVAFGLLAVWQAPTWLVVALVGIGNALFGG